MKTLVVLSDLRLFSADHDHVSRYITEVYACAAAEADFALVSVDLSGEAYATDRLPGHIHVEHMSLGRGIATGRLLSILTNADAVHIVSPFSADGEVCAALAVYAGKGVGIAQLAPVPSSLLSTTRLTGAIKHACSPNSYLANEVGSFIGCPGISILPWPGAAFSPTEETAAENYFVIPPCADTDLGRVVSALPSHATLCVAGRACDRRGFDAIRREAPAETRLVTDLSDAELCCIFQRSRGFIDWPRADQEDHDGLTAMTALRYTIEALACGIPVIISGSRSFSRDLRSVSGCTIVRTVDELVMTVNETDRDNSIVGQRTGSRSAQEIRALTDPIRQCRPLALALDALARVR